MASRDLKLLVPELQEKIALYDGPDILIYCTVRSCAEQAKLWRQSRSWDTIRKKIESFRIKGRSDLAQILKDVGPQHGKHVTHACCGESFHNYGLAFDSVPIKHGKPLWSSKNYEWELFGKEIKRIGLFWGGNWKNFKDMPHSQLLKGGNPLKLEGLKLCQ